MYRPVDSVWTTRDLRRVVDIGASTLCQFWPGNGSGNPRRWTLTERLEIGLAARLIGHRFDQSRSALGALGAPYRGWVLRGLVPVVVAEWLRDPFPLLVFEYPARVWRPAWTVDDAVTQRGPLVSTVVDLDVVFGPLR